MKSIVLIGFAAAGKSTIGKLLADKLGCNFVDCDQLLVAQQGKSVSQLFEYGEQHFRALENNLLATLPTQDTVIACGGGAVENANFKLFVQDATVVWLQIDVDTCIARLGQTARPLQDGKTACQLVEFMQKRNDLYRQFATITVDANGTIDQVTDQILGALAI